MAFPTIGATEGIIILVVILIVFGVGKLPQVGEAMGKGMRAFRKGQTGEDEDVKDAAKEEMRAPVSYRYSAASYAQFP